MDLEDEIEFRAERERIERAAAELASSPAVHDAHFVMAERYADRASSLTEQRYELEACHRESKEAHHEQPERSIPATLEAVGRARRIKWA